MPHTCKILDAADMEQLAKDTELQLTGLRGPGDTRDAVLKASFNDTYLARFAALGIVADERDRQLAKGWDGKHDDTHKGDELARAAACFAAASAGHNTLHYFFESRHRDTMVELWPWSPSEGCSRRQRTPLQNLAVAGALIVAEIERRLRAGERP